MAILGKGDGNLQVGVYFGIRLGKLIISPKPTFGAWWELGVGI